MGHNIFSTWICVFTWSRNWSIGWNHLIVKWHTTPGLYLAPTHSLWVIWIAWAMCWGIRTKELRKFNKISIHILHYWYDKKLHFVRSFDVQITNIKAFQRFIWNRIDKLCVRESIFWLAKLTKLLGMERSGSRNEFKLYIAYMYWST